MANTLGIPERTLAQLADSTNTINIIGDTDARLSAYEPSVVRVTDHADNDAGETGTDTDLMALFESSRHGEPWVKNNRHDSEKITYQEGLATGAAGTGTHSGGVIDALVVVTGGTNYQNPTVVIAADAGSGATATATVVDGVVTAIVITDGGTGYTTNIVWSITEAAPTKTGTLFPDYDYSTFE